MEENVTYGNRYVLNIIKNAFSFSLNIGVNVIIRFRDQKYVRFLLIFFFFHSTYCDHHVLLAFFANTFIK